MKKILLVALFFALCPLSLSAQKLYAIDNTTPNGYNFWLYVPGGYNDYRAERERGSVDKKLPAPLPIVIFLHGRSLSGTDLNKVRKYGTLDALAAGRKINAIVIAPQVTMNDWWRPNKVMSLVNWVADNYDVDTSRIYVLGMSLGGYGALDFAAAYPKETAAAMAFCGGSTRKASALGCLNEVPLWIMHGTADSAVPVSESRKVRDAMKAANANLPRLRYDEFVGGNHSIFARAFYTEEAYAWLFKHSTTDASRRVDRTIQIPQSRLSSQPYRGLNMRGRSTAFTVTHKAVAVPETSALKKRPRVTTKSSKSNKKESAGATTAKSGKTSQTAGQSDRYHIVEAGNTLSSLAVKYNTTVKQLCEWNDITENSVIMIGQRLIVEKAKCKYHTIVSGDTLSSLAVKYNTTVKQICEWNNITETTILQINQKLRVQ